VTGFADCLSVAEGVIYENAPESEPDSESKFKALSPDVKEEQ